jgi:hypothetical protein
VSGSLACSSAFLDDFLCPILILHVWSCLHQLAQSHQVTHDVAAGNPAAHYLPVHIYSKIDRYSPNPVAVVYAELQRHIGQRGPSPLTHCMTRTTHVGRSVQETLSTQCCTQYSQPLTSALFTISRIAWCITFDPLIRHPSRLSEVGRKPLLDSELTNVLLGLRFKCRN